MEKRISGSAANKPADNTIIEARLGHLEQLCNLAESLGSRLEGRADRLLGAEPQEAAGTGKALTEVPHGHLDHLGRLASRLEDALRVVQRSVERFETAL